MVPPAPLRPERVGVALREVERVRGLRTGKWPGSFTSLLAAQVLLSTYYVPGTLLLQVRGHEEVQRSIRAC